jgi:transcriptional regulator with XRE-family HTH domain
MTSPTPVYRRLVGGALRVARENIGYSLEDAAMVLECDMSKVSRIETGHRGIRPKELRELLTEYGVPQAEQDALLGLARTGPRRGGWWDRYASALPGAFADYLLMETAATDIMIYAPQTVPDLLQTDAYADAVAEAEAGRVSGVGRDDAAAARSERQAGILDGRKQLVVILGEAVLHQMVGGPEVMTAQLGRLTELTTQLPQMTLQVLPFTAGAHAASASGPVAILRFGDVPGLGAVRIGDVSGGNCLIGPEQVACHTRAFSAVRAEALTARKSGQLITEVAGRQVNAVLAGNALTG